MKLWLDLLGVILWCLAAHVCAYDWEPDGKSLPERSDRGSTKPKGGNV